MNASMPMTRRSWLTGTLGLIAASAVAPLTLAACGRGAVLDGGGSQQWTGDEVGSTQTRAAADPAALDGAVRAVQDFGAAAFAALAAGGSGNLVMSPASVHLALGMAALGARGRTATEMLSTLHAQDAVTLAHGLNALAASLAGCAGPARLDDGRSVTVEFAIADALWGQRGVTWNPAFLDALATDFGARMRVVDFGSHAEQARQAINAWVGQITRRTIPELIGPGVLDAGTRLALVNALYLKAPWSSPFDPSRTSPGEFTLPDGRQVRVPFMRQELQTSYATGPGWRAVRLDYAGRLAMTLVLPDPAHAEVITGLVGDRLRAILAAPRPALVDVAVPTWRTRTPLTLNDLLSGLGMPTAFTDSADFSGMTSQDRLAISTVLHQGYIAVDEAGTEASAATVVVMPGAAVLQVESVTFDRPFLYVLHDRQTQTPLFIGRMSDPTG